MTASAPLIVVIFTVVLLGGCGLVLGAVVALAVERVPDGRSLVHPGPSCPECGTEYAGRSRIALLMPPIGRGHCPTCGVAVARRPRLVEASTAAVWAVLGWWAWRSDVGVALLPLVLVLGAAGVALWFIDLGHHRLPDAIVLPLYPVTVVGLLVAGVIGGEWPWATTLVGAGLWIVVIGGLWLVSLGSGMGFGDVKLAPVLGATLGWIGWEAAALGLVLAFLLGGVAAITLLVSGRARRGSHLAFGPFLLVGASVALLAGPTVTEAYLSGVG